MNTFSKIAIAATIVGVASACTVRTETVERPAPVAAVATSPAPGTIVYTDPAPGTIVYTDPSPRTTTTTVYTP
jgi:hypothetical protein